MSPAISEDPAKKAVWGIETTNPEIVEAVENGLREVIDPEIGLNIIELGLVRNIEKKDDDSVHMKMIMTIPFCPYAPALLESARKKVEDILEVDTTIEMGMEFWDISYMEEGMGAEWGIF
jgi:metal-sulfur cluster biosynthetic enzyme